MPRGPTSFVVSGIEPASDPEWAVAGEPVRREFWRAVVKIVLDVRGKSLAMGLDRKGEPLRPVTEYTRKHRKSAMGVADRNAPALQPARKLSRTRAWFTGRAYPDRAQFYWTGGWGRILYFHAVGAKNKRARSGRLPVRDVIGLPPDDLKEVERRALASWRAIKEREDNRRLLGQLRARQDAILGPPRPLPVPPFRPPWIPPGVPKIVYRPYEGAVVRPLPNTIQVYPIKAPPPPRTDVPGFARPRPALTVQGAVKAAKASAEFGTPSQSPGPTAGPKKPGLIVSGAKAAASVVKKLFNKVGSFFKRKS